MHEWWTLWHHAALPQALRLPGSPTSFEKWRCKRIILVVTSTATATIVVVMIAIMRNVVALLQTSTHGLGTCARGLFDFVSSCPYGMFDVVDFEVSPRLISASCATSCIRLLLMRLLSFRHSGFGGLGILGDAILPGNRGQSGC